jgi:hypothetical protein
VKNVFFGIIDTFAIEISSCESSDLELPNFNPQIIYFYYWINGKRLAGGGGHVNDIHYSMRYVAFGNSSPPPALLCEAKSEDIFEVLDARINQRPTLLATLAASVPEDFLKFSLWFHHIFGHAQFFLIDCGADSRLIYGEGNGGFQGQVVAPIKSFVEAIQQAHMYLESLTT